MTVTQEPSPRSLPVGFETVAIEDATVSELLSGFGVYVENNQGPPKNRRMARYILEYTSGMVPIAAASGDNLEFVLQALETTNELSHIIGGRIDPERRGGDAKPLIRYWARQTSLRRYVHVTVEVEPKSAEV